MVEWGGAAEIPASGDEASGVDISPGVNRWRRVVQRTLREVLAGDASEFVVARITQGILDDVRVEGPTSTPYALSDDCLAKMARLRGWQFRMWRAFGKTGADYWHDANTVHLARRADPTSSAARKPTNARGFNWGEGRAYRDAVIPCLSRLMHARIATPALLADVMPDTTTPLRLHSAHDARADTPTEAPTDAQMDALADAFIRRWFDPVAYFEALFRTQE